MSGASRFGPGRWLLVLGVVLLAIGFRAGLRPVWTWDQIAYVGCVYEARGASAYETHRRAYGELERSAPVEVVDRLTGGNSSDRGQSTYRRAVHESPNAFQAQLGFYRGRWLYIRWLDGLNRLGIPIMHAGFLISLLACAAMGILLTVWLARSVFPPLAALLALASMEFAGCFTTASSASPDSLAAALLLGTAFAMTEARRPAIATLLASLALATRTDHVLLVAPLFLWSARPGFASHARLALPQLGIILAIFALVVGFCTLGQGTYSWWTVQVHTFDGYMAFPAEETPRVSVMGALERSVRSLPKFRGLQPLLFIVIALAGIWTARRKTPVHPGLGLCAVALAGLVTHFALFPVLWPRLMAPYWLLASVGLATQWRPAPGPSSTH